MLPIIFGCSGHRLLPAEKALFTSCQPAGFIIFKRNCRDKNQLRQLVQELKDCVQHQDVPVLIDQEGGRVMRLTPPVWPERAPAWQFFELYNSSKDLALVKAYEQARAIADDLTELGINVNCAPVLDVPVKGSHHVIGDRAYGDSIDSIVALAHATATGLIAGSVIPVVKHIPGHGRANADSHLELPIVTTDLATLQATDFKPFKALNAMPWAMTAHIVYTALDKQQPASTSRRIIDSVIRQYIGFDGVLISDDITMHALSDTPVNNARNCIAAGCDLTLHCSGDLKEMQAIAAGLPPITEKAIQRIAKSFSQMHRQQECV